MHQQISQSEVGQAMAVLGNASTVGLVAELLAADETAVRTAVRRLAVGSSTRALFDLDIADRILRDTPAPVRRELHCRAAKLLHDKGFPAANIAEQLVTAGAADYPWAAEVLLTAAAEALANDQIDRAVDLLELAYRATRDPADRAAIAIRLVRAEWRISPSNRTRNYTRVRAAVRAGRVPTARLPSAVMFLLWHGQVQHADQALGQLDCDRLDEATPKVDFLCAWLRSSHPPHAQRHQRLLAAQARRRPAIAAQPSPHVLGAQLLTGLFTGRPLDETVTLAQRLLTGHRLASSTVETLAAAVHCLIYTDRLDTAAAWCDSLLAEAEARQAPTWQSIFAGLRAETMLRKGNVRAAADDAVLALNHVPAEHLGVWIGTPIAALVRALTLAGRHAEAAAQLQRPVPRAMFESRFGLAYLHAQGHHHLAIGRADEALRTFRRCGYLMRRWHMDFAWLVPWRNDIAAAHLALGDPRHARSVATRHLDLLGAASQHRTGGVSLRLLAATADRYQRVRLLRDAAAIARSGGCDLELATVLGELGAAHRAVGDHDKSRMLIREATRLADSCGADTLLHELLGHRPHHLRQPIPRLRTHTNGLGTLSPAERRVAELAANGKRNRDIAAALDITTSTVEQHLTRVYRKLEIARRTELTFVFGTHPRSSVTATS
ncbi:LuxR family transcriptional regulator [Nocardia altamirensis]|uniref:LuxR family transcriptional regulator n=1 Tax=Nocardia altamirensis TaxID=472158 RepID=UPI00084048B2|nr:LuxR family transcriptional regulator [Nocardia altamirensis]